MFIQWRISLLISSNLLIASMCTHVYSMNISNLQFPVFVYFHIQKYKKKIYNELIHVFVKKKKYCAWILHITIDSWSETYKYNTYIPKIQPMCMTIHTEAFACRWKCGSIGGGAPICLSWFVIQNQVLQFTSDWWLRSKLLKKIKSLNIFNNICTINKYYCYSIIK